MKLVIALARHEIPVPIIREENCYNFFFFSVIEKDTGRFVKFKPPQCYYRCCGDKASL